MTWSYGLSEVKQKKTIVTKSVDRTLRYFISNFSSILALERYCKTILKWLQRHLNSNHYGLSSSYETLMTVLDHQHRPATTIFRFPLVIHVIYITKRPFVSEWGSRQRSLWSNSPCNDLSVVHNRRTRSHQLDIGSEIIKRHNNHNFLIWNRI